MKRGRAALTICSGAFVILGRAQASALGYAGLPIALVPHPFGVRKREEIRAIAETCVDDIVALVTRHLCGSARTDNGISHDT